MVNIFKNKRNIIIFVIIVLLLLFLVAVFFVSRKSLPEDCFNNIQDNGEQGIDCGGPCSKKCDLLESLKVLWTKIIPAGENKYYFLSLIKNPNALYGVSLFNYKFIGLNNEDKVVSERQGEDFILPGESKYIFDEINIEDLNNAQKFDLEISDLMWQRFSSYQKPTLFVINKEIKDIDEGGFNLKVGGRLINDSIYNLRMVGLKVVLFDERDNPIAFNKTYLGNIRSQEKRDFHVFWKAIFSQQEVKRIDIEAETNVFQEENFIKDYNYEHVNVRYENEK
ncbi:hypothetical protein D4R86_01635 [bacterium]|nr:MAG: hypothetical protein D4R86_01635 [bacterium]